MWSVDFWIFGWLVRQSQIVIGTVIQVAKTNIISLEVYYTIGAQANSQNSFTFLLISRWLASLLFNLRQINNRTLIRLHQENSSYESLSFAYKNARRRIKIECLNLTQYKIKNTTISFDSQFILGFFSFRLQNNRNAAEYIFNNNQFNFIRNTRYRCLRLNEN